MPEHSLLMLFNTRRKSMPSVISMTGSGLSGLSQVPALCHLEPRSFEQLKSMNILSSSALAYFVVQAHLNMELKPQALVNFSQQLRDTHQLPWHERVKRCSKVLAKQGSFFDNRKMIAGCKLLFSDEFLSRPLGSFPNNLRFWAFCEKKAAITEISSRKGYGEMTVLQVIRATASVPRLHGGYAYKNRVFSDLLFSSAAKEFLVKLEELSSNHLVINNIKEKDTHKGTLFYCTAEKPLSKADLIKEFTCIAFGMNNPALAASQRKAAIALQRLPLKAIKRPSQTTARKAQRPTTPA